jgi:hypothetical protein
MAALLGMNAKLYRLTTGTRASWASADSNGISIAAAPSNLDEIVNVKDLSLSLSTDKADVTTRGNNGWKATEPTLKDGTINFQMVFDSSDADFTALQRAFLNNTVIALAALSGDKATVGSQGLWADFKVSNFTKSENLTEAQMYDVELTPAYSSVAPQWVQVS